MGVSAFPADCTADPQQVQETDMHSENTLPSVATSELGNRITAPPGVLSTVSSEHANRPSMAVITGSHQEKYLEGLETRG